MTSATNLLLARNEQTPFIGRRARYYAITKRIFVTERTLVIEGQHLGLGDDDLGAQLMGSFLRKLWQIDNKPARIIFYNSGVKLLAEGSPVLDALHGLSAAGVDLIACGTCVTYFGIKDKVAVGRISDMTEIATELMVSPSVVTI